MESRLVRILHSGDDAGLHVPAGAAMQVFPYQSDLQAASFRCCRRAGACRGNSIHPCYPAA